MIECPEIFGEDEQGYPVLMMTDVPDEYRPAAERCVQGCPEAALRITGLPPAAYAVIGRDVMDSADKVEIHELITRYCHILDTRNWADLDKIFLPDSVVDSGPTLGVYHGIEAIAEFWRDYPHPDGHHALNVLVEEEQPDGTVKVVTKGFFARPGGFNGGDYHDVVRRTECGWRFVSRTYVPRWKVDVPAADQVNA
jgi:SnoaL-like protein